jgi:hypothetical protein
MNSQENNNIYEMSKRLGEYFVEALKKVEIVTCPECKHSKVKKINEPAETRR